MRYADVSVIVEGALDQETTVKNETELQRYVAVLQIDANKQGFTAEVYVVWHEHEAYGNVDADCDCIQYVTDHSPYATVEPEENGSTHVRFMDGGPAS